jgi:hypothetical protein
LQSGETVSGRVLALSKSETSVEWSEVHGTLEFKAFAMGPQKMIGLHASAWADGAARLEAAKPAMEARPTAEPTKPVKAKPTEKTRPKKAPVKGAKKQK